MDMSTKSLGDALNDRENTEAQSQTVRMTEYSHGSGCGCKIAPKLLEDILKTQATLPVDPRLLVGNDTKDDAAVYDLGNGTSVVSTTDFFMPIVDRVRANCGNQCDQ